MSGHTLKPPQPFPDLLEIGKKARALRDDFGLFDIHVTGARHEERLLNISAGFFDPDCGPGYPLNLARYWKEGTGPYGASMVTFVGDVQVTIGDSLGLSFAFPNLKPEFIASLGKALLALRKFQEDLAYALYESSLRANQYVVARLNDAAHQRTGAWAAPNPRWGHG